MSVCRLLDTIIISYSFITLFLPFAFEWRNCPDVTRQELACVYDRGRMRYTPSKPKTAGAQDSAVRALRARVLHATCDMRHATYWTMRHRWGAYSQR